MLTTSTSSRTQGASTPRIRSPRKSSHIVHTYILGDCVEISQRRVAIIKYVGKLKDMRGIWYGIEFIDGSVGSHNGVFRNQFYFKGSDKRCEFIQKSDIRRKLKKKQNSSRNIHAHHTLLTTLHSQNSDNMSETPQLPLQNQSNNNSQLTLKLRCLCFADPLPLELKCDINTQTIRDLKEEIIKECKSSTNLKGLFTENGNADLSRIDLYELNMGALQSKGRTNARVNSLNVKAGNIAYCILKKNKALFTKIALNNNSTVNDNVPLKYYKQLRNNQSLFVLFNFECKIKIIFQKTLFVNSDHSGDDNKHSEYNIEHRFSDDKKYIHSITVNVNILDKFDKLYLKIMELTGIQNINSMKLLSNTFIYAKSQMIEKFVYNEIDEGNHDLFLYFIHLTQVTAHKAKGGYHAHHVSRSRNHSLMSNYSTYSTFTHNQGSARNITSTLNSNRNVFHIGSGSDSHSASKERPKKMYTKVLLNFVTAKKTESYTILDHEISIKEFRDNICYKYKIACDKIKKNNDILLDSNAVKTYNFKENDILHILDESNINISISQSQMSIHKKIDIKINKRLTVKHIKFEVSKIWKYPMISQTLIMRGETLNDNTSIVNAEIKSGDTVRLVYNFGKRVKKLPNQKIKIPIITFNTNKKFEVIVSKNIFVNEIMQIIQNQKGIDESKQQLLFHGIVLDKTLRLNDYNITHQMHLFINK